MPSFDVVSEIDMQELDNAVNILKKEIETRYDFRGGTTEVDLNKKDKKIHVVTGDDMKMRALREMLIACFVRRKLDPKFLDFKDPEPTSGGNLKRDVIIREGIEKDNARKIVQMVKDSKLKVQASIMDVKVRVEGKKIDDLQAVMQLLRGTEMDIPVQFVNLKS